jgi:hypothetical protein
MGLVGLRAASGRSVRAAERKVSMTIQKVEYTSEEGENKDFLDCNISVTCYARPCRTTQHRHPVDTTCRGNPLSTATRGFIAFATVYLVQLLAWSSVLYYVRRQTYRTGYGSWLQAFTAYFILSFLITGLCWVPCGPFLAVPLYFFGVKQISGVGVLPAFALTLGVSVLLAVAAVVIYEALGVRVFGPPA